MRRNILKLDKPYLTFLNHILLTDAGLISRVSYSTRDPGNILRASYRYLEI